MYKAIFSAIVIMLKVLLPFISRKLNDPKTTMDAPPVPAHIRDAWERNRVRVS